MINLWQLAQGRNLRPIAWSAGELLLQEGWSGNQILRIDTTDEDPARWPEAEVVITFPEGWRPCGRAADGRWLITGSPEVERLRVIQDRAAGLEAARAEGR